MRILNNKYIWLSLILPLVGCGSLAQAPSNVDSGYTKQVVATINNDANKEKDTLEINKLQTKAQPVTKETTNLGNVNKVVSNSVNAEVPEVVTIAPLDESKIKDIKAEVKDPNVQLIAPPTSLPQTKYVVPQVAEKEKYTPRKTTSSKNKKKAVNKKVSKSSKTTTAKKTSSKKDVKTSAQKK